jgi:transposase
MIGSTRQLTVYACTAVTDMRKGYDGLAAVVSEQLGRDPLSGEVFLFVGRDRTRCKVLLWDGTGLCIYQKRLERGRFAALWRAEGEPTLKLTLSELQLFLEGSKLVGRTSLSPPVFSHANNVSAAVAPKRER